MTITSLVPLNFDANNWSIMWFTFNHLYSLSHYMDHNSFHMSLDLRVAFSTIYTYI
jgi:hypothetical protein